MENLTLNIPKKRMEVLTAMITMRRQLIMKPSRARKQSENIKSTRKVTFIYSSLLVTARYTKRTSLCVLYSSIKNVTYIYTLSKSKDYKDMPIKYLMEKFQLTKVFIHIVLIIKRT